MLSLNLRQWLELISESLEHHFLLVNLGLQFLFFFSSVILFTLDFVPGADGFQFGVFDFLSLLLKHISQSGNHLVEWHNLYRNTAKVRGKKVKFCLLLRKSMHSDFKFSVSRYFSDDSTLIWLFSSNVMLTSIFPASIILNYY